MESYSAQLVERLEQSPLAVAAAVEGLKVRDSFLPSERSLNSALAQIFPSRQEDTQLQRARRIMGAEVRDVADDELEKYVTEFQSLIDVWLDEYEQNVFDGSTLRQLLGGR